MARARSTRRFTFAAGHRYWVSSWSPEENERVFGRLTAPHGHNYMLDVTVHGEIDERTGMVIDLSELKRVVGETVVDRFDHADLNADPLFRDRVPTHENCACRVGFARAEARGRSTRIGCACGRTERCRWNTMGREVTLTRVYNSARPRAREPDALARGERRALWRVSPPARP